VSSLFILLPSSNCSSISHFQLHHKAAPRAHLNHLHFAPRFPRLVVSPGKPSQCGIIARWLCKRKVRSFSAQWSRMYMMLGFVLAFFYFVFPPKRTRFSLFSSRSSHFAAERPRLKITFLTRDPVMLLSRKKTKNSFETAK
jgi:hypothetical protein